MKWRRELNVVHCTIASKRKRKKTSWNITRTVLILPKWIVRDSDWDFNNHVPIIDILVT